MIQAKRKARGLSQESLAELAALNRGYLGKIERGVASPSIGTMDKLARALGETLSSLIAQCESEND